MADAEFQSNTIRGKKKGEPYGPPFSLTTAAVKTSG